MTTTKHRGIGGHCLPNEGRTDDWITPREIIEPLGAFHLDPCACNPMPWPTAETMVAPPQDGLSMPWRGRVWLNPPYGKQTGDWLARLAEHGWGMALIFARTETRFFFDHVWKKARAILFLRGRPHFCYPDGMRAKGNSGGPVCVVAYGMADALILSQAQLDGRFLRIP